MLKDYIVSANSANVTVTNTCYITKLETTKPDFYEYWWLNLTDNNEVVVTHSGKAYGFKDDLEKQLLIEFARKFPDVEVSDYVFKMRML